MYGTKNLSGGADNANVCSTASRTFWSLMQKLPLAPLHDKLSAYKTLGRPHLECACVLWNPYTVCMRAPKTDKVQRLAARHTCNRYRQLDTCRKG